MIEIHNLLFHYTKSVPIFNDISTSLLPGHIYGLLGLNGIGKTTFLKLICGLLFPKTGTVKVDHLNPSERDVAFLSDVYFVTDEVDLPNWTITNLVDIYSPLYPKFDKDYFSEMLMSFDVDSKAHIKALSYGQRKKVNIAFALATNVNLLLMDEPTNGLDIPSKTQFRRIIAKHVSAEKTIIISTHQIRDIYQLIDHLLILQKQQLILDTSIYELGTKVKFQQGLFPDALYSETSLSGHTSMLLNTDNETTSFDMELFFNAITNDPDLMNKLTHLNLSDHE